MTAPEDIPDEVLEEMQREAARKRQLEQHIQHHDPRDPDYVPKPRCQHVPWQTADAERPTEICDRNGEVVLAQCKLCGLAEVELDDGAE